DFFTGGEKSGLAVQNPNFPGSGGGDGNSLVDHDQDDQDSKSYSLKKKAKKVNTFTGSGYVLGDEESPSRVIPDLNAAATASGSFAQARAIRTETVVRHLTFWRDGFTIEDGPLFRYDDPANQQHLKAIDSGHAPLSLLNVVPGQKVDVHVAKKTDEDYKPPKRVVGGYSGSGFRLGSPVPGETFSSPAASTATPTSVSAASTSSDLGTTGDARLQIRLGNGQRLTARFDSNDLIDVIYNYVSANDASNGRAYVLQTTFPNKELTDRQISIKQAGVAGAVLVQKW
ncbi:SEP-domain-containing protein, partial [Nadsonia fulvescens var. elongata DSM 6958]